MVELGVIVPVKEPTEWVSSLPRPTSPELQMTTLSMDPQRKNMMKMYCDWFNADKLQLKCNEASFFGHTWTPKGVKPDNKKVSAILAMKPPDNAKDLQSFLGLVNYLTRYSSQLATLTAPLRELTKKEIVFVWGPEHDIAFQAVNRKYCL